MSLSIIIPVHNSEAYLKECVDSALRGLNGEDEVILVENGSSDSSWAICRGCDDADPRVRAVRLDTAGVSGARNRGISEAKGAWIVFLDPGLVPAIHDMDIDADIVLCRYRFLDEEPARVRDHPSDLRKTSPELLRRAVLQYAKYRTQISRAADMDNVTIWSCCAKVLRREFLIRHQIRFPEPLCLSEDTAFSLQLYCSAEKVFSMDQNAFFYRRTLNSASRVHHPKLLENNQYLREWTYDYVRSKGLFGELKEELYSFLSRKFIDECLYLMESVREKDDGIRYIRENASVPFMAQALGGAGYRHLIAGKRNCLRHWPILWALKRKQYALLFTPGFIKIW